MENEKFNVEEWFKGIVQEDRSVERLPVNIMIRADEIAAINALAKRENTTSDVILTLIIRDYCQWHGFTQATELHQRLLLRGNIPDVRSFRNEEE